MTKAELRKIYKEKRKKLSGKDIVINSDLVLINFQKINLPFLSCVHTYIASQQLMEVETYELIKFLQFKNPGIKVAVPKINIATGNLEHFHLEEEIEMIDNLFGIPEPAGGTKISVEEIDLILVPLLAFDKKGYRVGYGKGYYDKFLSQCREDVIKIGLSFFEAEERIKGINQFDIPLNYCVTPHHVYTF
ncbi:MAG: 5-formyltetrahydrofolate cyclo-ligase [Bacteroidota bacterium]|nr:5-formyltetrahydrofolate cyclo-ligase [Bacteroidota bacterium]MDQ6889373.1 5-formyltetrahydrofolate cyclo-ligase [Bacteroidota bacterium]